MTISTGSNKRAAVWLAPIITGALLFAAFPGNKYPVAAWVAFVPLLAAVRKAKAGPLTSFLTGWLAGWIFFFLTCNWITVSMTRYGGMNKFLAYLAAALFCAIAGIFHGLFLSLVSRLDKWWGMNAWFFVPVLWTATEWLRGFTTGMTWNELGVSQVSYIQIAKFAQFGGALMVGFIVMSFNTLVLVFTEAFTKEGRRVVSFFLFLGLLGYFLSRQSDGFFIGSLRASGAEITAAVIQPVLPVDLAKSSDEFASQNKAFLEKTRKLLDDFLKSPQGGHPDLIIWPESPLALEYGTDEAITQNLNQIAREYRSYFIFSAIGRDGQKIYNSAQTLNPEGKPLNRYDKRRLMPFGEYVPFRPLIGWLVPPMVGDFNQGTSATVNTLKLLPRESFVVNEKETQGEVALQRTTNFLRLGIFICYESAYPVLVSDFVRQNAGMLVNISDDAWFGDSAGPRQHMDHVRMRAIENYRDVLRVTNSGVTGLIRADGSVEGEIPMFSPQATVLRASEHKELTFFAKYGNWFAVSSFSLVVLLLGIRFFQVSRKPAAK